MFSDGSTMTGMVDDSGNLTLNMEGRWGIMSFFPAHGPNSWNIDNSSTLPAPVTGIYEALTTGNSISYHPTTGDPVFNMTGMALAGTPGSWTGRLVSAGNVGTAWGPFDGTPYSEIFNITVTGTAASPVPIPAAAWLFGSGLLGLVGLVRRKKVVT
jgi:hypothetical protein